MLTFEPHPRLFFNPGEKLFRLTDEAAKLRLFAATGLDGAIILTFDAALAKLTAEEFVERILVERFGVSGAVIGFNFYFGARRGGSPDFLVAQGKKHGFTVDIVPPLRDGERPVLSGPTAKALEAGQLDKAAEFLGFPWFVSGEVIHGDKRGRELGFPTANVALNPACRLRHGIYAVRAAVDGKRYDAVASFGRRPTFDNGPVLLEIFLFDFSAIFTARPSTSHSSNGFATRRLSPRLRIRAADARGQPIGARGLGAGRGCIPADLGCDGAYRFKAELSQAANAVLNTLSPDGPLCRARIARRPSA